MGRDQVRRAYGIMGAVVGLVGMWGIAAVAPPQPEYWHRGGACNTGPCTTLEEPAAWMALWRPFAVLLLLYAVSLFLLLLDRARTQRARSSSIAPALVVAAATMAGTFLLEVYGAHTSFHMGVTMAIASSVLLGLAAASLIPEDSGARSAAVALVQAFSYAIPRVINEFVALRHGSEPFPNATFGWVYVIAGGIFLGGALIQTSFLARDDLSTKTPTGA